MLALLPLATFVNLVGAVRPNGAGLRDAFLRAAVVWGLLVAGFTEGLSAIGCVNRFALSLAWSLAWIISAVLALRHWRREAQSKHEQKTSKQVPFMALPGGNIWTQLRTHGVELLVALPLLAIFGLTAYLALAAAPNSWDAMTYHLARVGQWVQHGHVGLYPTHCLRQLHMPPWAEYAILQFVVLQQSDLLANGVQWFAGLGCAVAASLLASAWHASARTQWLAALLTAAVPMLILQASSTQNDLACAFWLTALAYFLVRLERAPGWSGALWAGASLGLALLTKGTAYVFAPALVLAAGTGIFWNSPRPAALLKLGCCALLALAINLPHFARNLALHGSPLPASEGPGYEYRIAELSLPSTVSNLTRNIAMNLGLPWEPATDAVYESVIALHEWADIDPNDPGTTWPGTCFVIPLGWEADEDRAGNFPHTVLFAVAGIFALFDRSRSRYRVAAFAGTRVGTSGIPPRTGERGYSVIAMAAALLAGLVLFSALMRWQPWHTRLLLPLFVLGCPLLALALRSWPRPLAVAAVAGALAWCVPYLLWNTQRPLLGLDSVADLPRERGYFAGRPHLHSLYGEAIQVLREHDARHVGWLETGDSWEYPLRVLYFGLSSHPSRLDHVAVVNPSARFNSPQELPDMLVTSGFADDATRVIENATYAKLWSRSGLCVYRRLDPQVGQAP